jgi:hypothetical protein
VSAKKIPWEASIPTGLGKRNRMERQIFRFSAFPFMRSGEGSKTPYNQMSMPSASTPFLLTRC